ncbi:hypothetical protein RJT34_13902 [Clitoria ternatea]|uniref:PGG domain-containing protein n=1 Tax=Clitoria ternatea TaxID=43366 RepID=A0AAN9PM91_CLITE
MESTTTGDDRAMNSDEREEEMERANKRLFKHCMKGDWEKVVEIYKNHKRAQTARITKSCNTALHVAVTDGQDDVVRQLVQLICSHEDQREEVLRIQNERGNTALHFAASMGSVEMCECIAEAEASLLSIRNVDGETPLFLAALHGRKEAFLALHYIHISHNDPETHTANYYSICRRIDGDTILHSAIANDYFDLAFQIIHLYKDLVNMVNENGLSPLHLLANKPSVFRSGSRLGRFEAIIYYCIIIKKLEVAPSRRQQSSTMDKDNSSYPGNYQTCMELLTVVKKSTLVVAKPWTQLLKKRNDQIRNERDPEAQKRTKSSGSEKLRKIQRKKEKHMWSAQISDELLGRASTYEYEADGSKPQQNFGDKGLETVPYDVFPDTNEGSQPSTTKGEAQQQKNGDIQKVIETPILIAAKNGVKEMVEKIMELFPVAVHDMDAKKKNIVLLAVENRQTYLYEFLLKRKTALKESIFSKVDNDGNSVLHLAAKLGDYKPWLIPGEALQMHWEIKWYLFVKESMQPHFFRRYNNENKTPRDIFSESHKQLVKSGGEWLKKTSESCSVVAALIATVAFSTSTTVPGGVLTAVVVFLSILTSRFQERDFGKNLPRKLIIGLTSLFMSITAMMVSFCAGHFFVLKDKLRTVAYPVYAVTCLPVTLFALAQFPLYIDLIWATL